MSDLSWVLGFTRFAILIMAFYGSVEYWNQRYLETANS